MSTPPRQLTARQVEALLLRQGFQLVAELRGHRKWRHPRLRMQIVVPDHGGRNLPVWFTKSF